ncbi:MAG: 50S ribosomal protein L24 [Nitrospinota bacterium]|nr:50S ribosomal protein L24 [Nitrospinota bacterium]
MKIRKDDIVELIAGKDKGRRGKVLSANPVDGFVTVEKLNMVKKHQKPNAQMRQGGIVDKENKIRVDNVKVVCSKCDKAVRVGKKALEDGKKTRICRSCGEVLDAV